MRITETPPRILAACYLTESFPIMKERVSGKDINLDLPGVQEVSLDELGCLEYSKRKSSRTAFPDNKTYLLIPQGEVKDFMSILYQRSDITQAQEVLEFLENGSIEEDLDIGSFQLKGPVVGWKEKSTDVGSKSFRLSIEHYIKVVMEAFEKEICVSDIMKEYLKEGIQDLIDTIESHLDISKDRKKYLQEELDSWAKGKPVRNMYKLNTSYIPRPEDKEITQIEYKLVEEYLRETARKHLSEEHVEEFMRRCDFSYLKEDERSNLVSKLDMKMKQNSQEGVMFSNCLMEEDGEVKMDIYRPIYVDFEGDEEGFQEFMEEIEKDEEFREDLPYHFVPPKRTAFELSFGEDGSYLGYFDLEIDLLKDEQDELTLLIEGIHFEDDDFAEKLTEKMNEKREGWFEKAEDDHEELKDKIQEHVDRGEWKKARELNERLMVLEKIDDFHHFYAKMVEELTSQVTTITANENFFPFVKGIRILDKISED
ncbi:MAG: hypothetical protein ACOCSJ_05755 [Candidatus Natronoplasma sp.]